MTARILPFLRPANAFRLPAEPPAPPPRSVIRALWCWTNEHHVYELVSSKRPSPKQPPLATTRRHMERIVRDGEVWDCRCGSRVPGVQR